MWQYLFDPAVHWGEHEGEAESQGSVCGRVEEWPRFHEGDEDGEDGHKGDVQASIILQASVQSPREALLLIQMVLTDSPNC